MSTALDELRAKNRHDVTLPSGLVVTIRLPRIRDCIIAGGIPLPVLMKLDASEDTADAPDLSEGELRATAAFNDELVRAAIVAIEGEPVVLATVDVGEFDDADYDVIAGYASRKMPLPGKG